jgi:integrase
MACITKRRDRWVVDFYDQHGKRRWKTLPKGATKGKAKEELRAIEDSVDRRTFLPVKKVPTFSTVAEDWIEHKKTKVRITTWECYESHVRTHFKELEGVKINRITTATMEKYITDRENQGMNISTIRKILVTLNQVMSYAVRHKYIDHNPLTDAERPRKRGTTEKKKIEVLSPYQIAALLDAEKNQQYRTMFILAVFSGVREGELLGLKWSDIDWKNSQVHIQRTYNKGRFFDTKTEGSNRKIDLGPKVITGLKKWKLACPVNNLDLMFPNEAGGPINYSNMVRRHFQPALQRAGVHRIRFHDIRHTFASLLIEQGENIKYIQNQLGHSSPTVTLNVYAHLMKETNQKSACKLENTVFGGNR